MANSSEYSEFQELQDWKPQKTKPIVENLFEDYGCAYCKPQDIDLPKDTVLSSKSFDEKISKYSHFEEYQKFCKKRDKIMKKELEQQNRLKPIEKLLTEPKPHDIDWRNGDLEETKSLQDILREPVKCPHCNSIMGITSILKHYQAQHLNGDVFFIELYLQQRCLHSIEPLRLKFNKLQVLTIFAYGGELGRLDTTLISRGIALPNMMLCEESSPIQLHTPVLLIICRTTMLSYLGNRDVIDKLVADEDNHPISKDVWIIWLAAAEMLKPLYATLTVYDEKKTKSFSRIVCVRNIADPQNCVDFLAIDTNYIDLTYATICEMTHNVTKPMILEVIFDEYKDFDNKLETNE